MSSDTTTLIREFYEAFYNEKDLVEARAMMTDDLNNHHPPTPASARTTPSTTPAPWP